MARIKIPKVKINLGSVKLPKIKVTSKFKPISVSNVKMKSTVPKVGKQLSPTGLSKLPKPRIGSRRRKLI
jgi:hypothetical protein